MSSKILCNVVYAFLPEMLLGGAVIRSFAENLEPWISRERLEAHRPSNGDDLSMVTNYLYNIALCEALYTPLSFLEVGLRNSLHTNLSELFGSSTWFHLPGTLESNDARAVANVTKRIRSQGKAATSDRIVSELSFGFWVSLLSSPYDARLWRPNSSRALKSSFPNVP